MFVGLYVYYSYKPFAGRYTFADKRVRVRLDNLRGSMTVKPPHILQLAIQTYVQNYVCVHTIRIYKCNTM